MVRLFWAKCNNFGDELSPYIISELSGEKVIYRRNFTLKKFISDIKRFVKAICVEHLFEKHRLQYSIRKKIILGIGSIINESTMQCTVWGAGIISKNTIIKGGTFKAVRGEKTQQRLAELGFIPPLTIGDPALLLPIIYTPIANEEPKLLGIIPHVSEYKEIRSLFINIPFMKIIDLRENDLEKIIDEINSCDNIISTSLHGLIVAHAYNIPAIYFENRKLNGDGIKFKDYFSSVDIIPYAPFHINSLPTSEKEVIKFFKEKNKYARINNDLKVIQTKLLKSAPFNIKKKYLITNE
jgi:hypothetical protein